MNEQLVSRRGRSRHSPGRANAHPYDHLRRRPFSARLPYRTLVLSWTVSCLVCLALSELPASAQLPPVKNPLAPGQNPVAAGCSTTDASPMKSAAG